jgi:hypothetical protein
LGGRRKTLEGAAIVCPFLLVLVTIAGAGPLGALIPYGQDLLWIVNGVLSVAVSASTGAIAAEPSERPVAVIAFAG